jgi:hypothetical protein
MGLPDGALHVESLREAYLARIAKRVAAAVLFDVRHSMRKAKKAQGEDAIVGKP